MNGCHWGEMIPTKKRLVSDDYHDLDMWLVTMLIVYKSPKDWIVLWDPFQMAIFLGVSSWWLNQPI